MKFNSIAQAIIFKFFDVHDCIYRIKQKPLGAFDYAVLGFFFAIGFLSTVVLIFSLVASTVGTGVSVTGVVG